MIIQLQSMENEMVITESYVNVLEIDNNKYFATIIHDIFNDEEDSKEIRILDKDILNYNKDCCIIIDFFNLELNEKNIITKLYKVLSELYNKDDDLRSEYESLNYSIQKHIDNLMKETDLDYITNSSVDYKELLKFCGLRLKEYNNIADKLINLINLNSDLKLFKILILVNAKPYLNKKDIVEIYKMAYYKKVHIILLECKPDEEMLEYEKKWSIDKDLYDVIK